jgi:hypothetical protein
MVRQAVWVACLLFAGSVHAQEEGAKHLEVPAPTWRIAPEVSRYRYQEPGTMRYDGTLYGIVGSYTSYKPRDGRATPEGIPEDPWLSWSTARIEGRLSFGQVDYDGAYMDGTPLSTSGTDDLLIDLRVMWGIEWQTARPVNAFYAGLGYRYLNDDSTGLPGGYERESNYLYVPIGTRRDFDLSGRWELGLTGEFNVLIIGRQISHLDRLHPSYPKVRNWQWPGFGATASVELRHRGEWFDLALAPFVRYWWIDESDVSQGYYEPENNTLEYGLSFVIRF